MAGADPLAVIFLKLTIKGSLTGNMRDVEEALDFVRRGIVKPKVIVKPFSEFIPSLKALVSVSGSLRSRRRADEATSLLRPLRRSLDAL